MHMPDPHRKRAAPRGSSDDSFDKFQKKKAKRNPHIIKANKLAAVIKKSEQDYETTMSTCTTTAAASTNTSHHSAPLDPFMALIESTLDPFRALLHTTSTGGTGTFRYIGTFGDKTYQDSGNSNVDIRQFKNRPLTTSMDATYDKTIAEVKDGGTIKISFKGYNVRIDDLKRLRQPGIGIRHRQLWLDDSVSLRIAYNIKSNNIRSPFHCLLFAYKKIVDRLLRMDIETSRGKERYP